MEVRKDLAELADLLSKRLAIIGNHDLRERDPDEQLRQLQEVSESILAQQHQLSPGLSPRLAHFLENCSYDKALAWIKGGNG